MRAVTQIMDDWVCTIIGLMFVVRYYSANPRHTGLMGRGSLRTWRQKLIPDVRVADSWDGQPILVHVSGPGDARAAEAFIQTLRAMAPQIPLYVMCETGPALEYLSDNLDDGGIYLCWLPFDLLRVWRRLFRRLRPQAHVDTQAGFWPNLILELHRTSIPSIFLRVDMMDWDTQEEFPRWLRPWYARMLSMVTYFSARSSVHKQRLIKLGVEESRVVVGQNYRLEVFPTPDDSRAEEFTRYFGVSESLPLVVIANARLDETKAIVTELGGHFERLPFRLLVAPAELDVCYRAERWLRSQGFGVIRRSSGKCPGDAGEVVVLDTHGELHRMYSVAQVAIVGDTFPPVFCIGANPWEPLVQGCMILYGPDLPDFEPVEGAEAVGAAGRVSSYTELPKVLERALACPVSRDRVREIAVNVARDHVKASEVDARLVLDVLKQYRTGKREPHESVPEVYPPQPN